MLRPELRYYVILPILINIIIIGTAFFFIYQKTDDIINYLLSYLPTWLHWLDVVLWPLILISTLVFFGYFFTTLANIIAAPFNGLLSAKVENLLTNATPSDDSWAKMGIIMLKSIQREFQNLAYYLPRLIAILILFLVPIIGTLLAPLLLFLFNAWMMSIQYHDYAFDNNKISFPSMLKCLKKDRFTNVLFGSLINIATMLPLVNLFIMPAAVCGGTLHWVEKYRSHCNK